MTNISYKNIGEIIPYRAITNNAIISVNPDQITGILEIHISEIDSEDIMTFDHEQLMNVLCEIMPPNSWVSVYLSRIFSEKNIPIHNRHKNEIVNYLERKRVEKINSAEHPEYYCYLAITIPANENKSNDFKFLDKLTNKEKNDTNDYSRYSEALEKLEYAIARIKSSINGSIIQLTSDQILYFFSHILNHSYMNNYSDLSGVFSSDFTMCLNGAYKQSNPGYVHYGSNYHSVMSLRAYDKESKLPDYTTAAMNKRLFSERINDIPFTVQLSMFFPEKRDGLKAARVRSGMIAFKSSSGQFFGNLFKKTPEGLPPEVLKEYIDEQIQIVETTSERFVRMSYKVYLWDNDLNTLLTKTKRFSSEISSSFMLKTEKYNVKASYMSIFPGMEHINPINIMLSSTVVSDFLPIDMPRTIFKNKRSTNFVYFNNEVDCLVELDLYDRRASNWNSLVCGGSGSGKSFFVNALIDQYMIYNPQIAIVDYGGEGSGSYRNLVLNNKGTYIEIGFDKEQKFSVNPFDGPYLTETGEIIAIQQKGLLATIERMATTSDRPTINREIQQELCRLFMQYYTENNNNTNNSCDLSDFANKYLRDNELIRMFGRNLYAEIFMFINDGIYARFFKKTADLPDKDIICFDLAGLKEHAALRNVLIPTLLHTVTHNILAASSIDRKKFLIFDEAWKDLKGGDMTDFMEAASRTLRKLNGQITIISQLLEDILDSPIGKALIANTSYYYFIGGGHNRNALPTVKATSEIGTRTLTEYDIESIHNQKGKRDVHLMTPFFSGMIRFKPTIEFCMYATTDAEEKRILNKYKHSLGVDIVTPDVIEAAKKEFMKM